MQRRRGRVSCKQSYGTQRSSSAIEILQFLTMEILFCVSCSVENEVCLFESHGTPGGVSLISSLSEGKNLPSEFDNPNSNILQKYPTVISCSKPVSHWIENCDMLFNSAFTHCEVLVIVEDMGKWGWRSNSTARSSWKGLQKVLHFPMSPSQCFSVFRCLLFCTALARTYLEFQSLTISRAFLVFPGNVVMTVLIVRKGHIFSLVGPCFL